MEQNPSCIEDKHTYKFIFHFILDQFILVKLCPSGD